MPHIYLFSPYFEIQWNLSYNEDILTMKINTVNSA